MQLVEIKNKEELNSFLIAQEHSSFLESWGWGEFQAGFGNKILRFGVLDNEELIAVITLVEKKLPLGMKYWYAPRGPVVNYELRSKNYELIFNFLIEELEKKAKSEKVIFARVEPQFTIPNSQFTIERSLDVQPAKTLLLDLTKSEEELLKAMHEKTRYNIRLSAKKGVEVREWQNLENDFEEFWKIMEETKNRDGFRLHGKNYYLKMLENFQFSIFNFQTISNNSISNNKLIVKLFLAKHNGRVIAGNIVAFFGDTVTYVHGASSNEFRNLMAPYALQWHCIKLAKQLGYKFYDFYGIDEKKWPGVTRFKKGFSGFEYEYPGTFDVVFWRTWYNVYQWVRKMRRVI